MEEKKISQIYRMKSSRIPTLIFLVPGIGIKSSPWARTHAMATCAAVALCFAPMDFSSSAMARMLGKFSWNLMVKNDVY